MSGRDNTRLLSLIEAIDPNYLAGWLGATNASYRLKLQASLEEYPGKETFNDSDSSLGKFRLLLKELSNGV